MNDRLLQTPWYNDRRSKAFSHETFFGYTPRPKTLNKPRFSVEDQGDTQRCAAFAAAKNGERIHGIKMSPEWQTSKISRIQGSDVTTTGSNPNAAMNSQLFPKGGYLPATDWNPMQATQLDTEASNYGDSGYVRPDGGIDVYDGICNALHMAYNQQTCLGASVQAFSGWYDSFNGANITEMTTIRGYHSYLFVDYDDDKQILLMQNSWGEGFGDGGYQTMTRAVANKLFTQSNTSVKIPKPLTKEQIALARQETPFGRIQRAIIDIWYVIATRFYAQLSNRKS